MKRLLIVPILIAVALTARLGAQSSPSRRSEASTNAVIWQSTATYNTNIDLTPERATALRACLSAQGAVPTNGIIKHVSVLFHPNGRATVRVSITPQPQQ